MPKSRRKSHLALLALASCSALLGVLMLQRHRRDGLWNAIQQNDPAGVRSMTLWRVSVQETDSAGRSPLVKAIREQKYEAAKALLEMGAEATRSDPDGQSPLLTAAQGRDAALVRTLLERGADPNSRTRVSQRTPLLFAASGGRYEIVKLLLERGADVNAQDRMGQTALGFAAQNQFPETMRLLLQRGANPNLPRLSAPPREMLPDLLPNKNTQVSYINSNGETRDPRARFVGGDSRWGYLYLPLHLAISQGNTESVRLLLEHGADVEQPDSDGQTPLMRAARLWWEPGRPDAPAGFGCVPLVQLLLQRKAKTNERDSLGQTPLMLAAHDANVLRLLLDAGSEVNATRRLLPNESETDPIVRTAFGRAAAQGNIAGMRLLFERGAQLSAAERDAALYAAVESAHLDSMRFLAQRGARLSAERAQRLLFDAMRWNDIAPLQFLFAQGANPTLAPDRKGRTPLQHALFQQNEQVLAFLKSKGITPTAEDLASVERWRLEPQKRISMAGR